MSSTASSAPSQRSAERHRPCLTIVGERLRGHVVFEATDVILALDLHEDRRLAVDERECLSERGYCPGPTGSESS